MKVTGLLESLIDQLNPMPDGRVGTRLQMGQATDIGRYNDLGARCLEVFYFVVTQLIRQRRLGHGVGAGRTTAQVTVGT